jgi:hypothetical protein
VCLGSHDISRRRGRRLLGRVLLAGRRRRARPRTHDESRRSCANLPDHPSHLHDPGYRCRSCSPPPILPPHPRHRSSLQCSILQRVGDHDHHRRVGKLVVIIGCMVCVLIPSHVHKIHIAALQLSICRSYSKSMCVSDPVLRGITSVAGAARCACSQCCCFVVSAISTWALSDRMCDVGCS